VKRLADRLLPLRAALALACAFLMACSSTERPKPTELEPNVPLLGVRQVWTNAVGPVDFPLDVRVVSDRIYVAGSSGLVAALDAESGKDIWRANLDEALSAGVGSDGRLAAVVTRGNELVLIDAGKPIWRQRLSAATLTAPLVAGGRVFTVSADRTVNAFDAKDGRRLWKQQRNGDALVLGQAGLITAVGDTLVVGLSGRVVGMNPLTGVVRWDVSAANSRGTNEVERLVDVVSGFGRNGSQLCVRAYQYAVTCLDALAGRVLWSKAANGSTGISGDTNLLVGSESDGKLLAWRQGDGERLWTSERLRFLELGAPLLAGRSVVVGDNLGVLHFLSREDASPLNRMPTDGSPLRVPPVLAGKTLVVVSAKGGVFAFRPE
jgi:outer membrane protein assembly factor BamB